MKRLRTLVILAVIAAIVGGAVGLSTSFLGGDDNVAEASSLYIAPVTAIGPDAFSPSFSTGQLPADYAFEFESGQIAASSESLYIQPRGTYGGPGSNVCDKEGMKEFFRAHPDRAAAWARIQGIEVAEIDAFLDGLNTAFLAQNVKLTMYGFKNGQSYGYEAIIKAGTAVLVDELGLPRARCACGNPLVTDNPPPPETTTTTTTTTTEPGITIEECPEGTTYYRNEDGLPQSTEPMVDEYVEIDSSDTGFNPSPLDDNSERNIEPWYPTTDLCAPECPEYTPQEGEYYDDSWRYENGQWVSLFGDVDPISDTRLLPGWTDDCGVCPPDDPGPEDVAPPQRRYDDSFATWDSETEQWIDADGNPTEPAGSDGALTDPIDLDVQEISPELEQSLEDEFNNDYDPCAPACPLDEYLGQMPTWFPDPAGFSWTFDRSTGLWTPSNGGAAQADPPSWIADRLATYARAYDPNGPCGIPPSCPPASGSNAVRYIVDNDGVMWTLAGGRWYSTSGDIRDTIGEFPGCSPCPADTPNGAIYVFYDSTGLQWLRNAQGGWFNLFDNRVVEHVWLIPGYVDQCASTECPDGTPAIDDVYIDGQSRPWRWTGEAWISDDDGQIQSVRTSSELPDCNPEERSSTDAPVTASIACTYNTDTQQHQMRVLTEGLTSQIAVVIDDLPPNYVYRRVGNLFYRILDAKPSGTVEIRIILGSGPPIIYNHDVADCKQATPNSGATGVEFFWTCGYNVATHLYEARGLAVSRGTDLAEIRSLTLRLDNRVFVRGGNTFTLGFPTNPAGAFYVLVEMWDGGFNELLVDVGRCDDVLTPGWSRMKAESTCYYDNEMALNRFMTELSGATSEVVRVGDLATGMAWNRQGFENNIWYLYPPESQTLPARTTLAVEMADGFTYSFPFDINVVNGRCTPDTLPMAFDLAMHFACGINGSGEFELQVLPEYSNAAPDGSILNVNDSVSPGHRYDWFLGGYRAEWTTPPDANSAYWVTVTLLDGRFNQYLISGNGCELPLRAVNSVELGESEEPLQIETTTTTTTLPRVVAPIATTTTTTLPTVATTTTTTTTAPATTTGVNRAPTITLVSNQCTRTYDAQAEATRFTFNVTATVNDPDGDVVMLTANARDFNQGVLVVTPSTTTVNGDGVRQFTVTAVNTGGLLAVVANDGREGFSSDAADLNAELCVTG